MRNSASKYLIQKERDGLSPIPVSLHQAGVPLPASLLTQRVCSSTISTSDANDPMAIISMLFLFVKQSAFICLTFIKDDQRVGSLPGVPPCAESATGGAHGGNLTKYNVGRWLEDDLEERTDGMHKEKAPDIV